MKTTGVVRRIDDLGRIVIPKEIRRTLRIRDGESLEIFVDKEMIALKKYSSMDDMTEIAKTLADTISPTIKKNIFITDRDRFIVTTGEEKKKYSNKAISRVLEQHMNDREILIEKNPHSIELLDGKKEEYAYIINPINVKGDVVGLVIILSVEFIPDEYQKNEFNILAIGRFMPQKAFARLITVCAGLRDEGLKFKLNIIGEGPEEDIIKEKISELDMKDNVQLLGFKENPYPYIKEADLFVCASIHESYCLVVAESLVVGTPVVSTMCTGPIELLDNGRYGLLVENSENGLCAGIREMVNTPEKLSEYKNKTKDRREFFSIEESMKAWEEIFERC